MVKQLLAILLLSVCYGLPLTAQDLTATPDADLETALTKLNETPPLFNFTTETVKQIYVRGLELGNRPQVFTKMGDSDTTEGGFFRIMGMGTPGQYCDLGEYEALQESIDYYASVPPYDGVKNSFDNGSLLAHKGFMTSSVLDPLWAEAEFCTLGETPISCEYRMVQPGSAIIMLGVMDIQYLTVEDYKANMGHIIESSMEMGVIPILTTFVVMKERQTDKLDWRTSILFNAALIELSEAYHTPLINLWREAQPLPNSGVGSDETHLAYRRGTFCDFTGPETEYGGTLRNLLSLQGLDLLRREVFERPDNN